MCDIGLQIRRRRPHVAARVRDLLDNRVQRDDVLGGPPKEDERDGAVGCGGPGDDEGRADGDLLVEARCGDGIAGGGRTNGGGVGGGEGGEEGGEEEGGAHLERLKSGVWLGSFVVWY